MLTEVALKAFVVAPAVSADAASGNGVCGARDSPRKIAHLAMSADTETPRESQKLRAIWDFRTQHHGAPVSMARSERYP
jgi:hypothetical protein